MLSFLFGLIVTLAIFIFSNSFARYYYIELLQQDFKKEIYCITSISSLLSHQITHCHSKINQKSICFFIGTVKQSSWKPWSSALWKCPSKSIWRIEYIQSLYSRDNSIHQLEIPYCPEYWNFNKVFSKTFTRFSRKTALYNFYWPCSPEDSWNFRIINMWQGKKWSI